MIHEDTTNQAEAVRGHAGAASSADQAPEAHPAHRLGPLWSVVPLHSSVGGRLYAAGVLAGVIAVFVVAARLHPEGLSHGAHQQLGLPGCPVRLAG
jgi:hypothetical protein